MEIFCLEIIFLQNFILCQNTLLYQGAETKYAGNNYINSTLSLYLQNLFQAWHNYNSCIP